MAGQFSPSKVPNPAGITYQEYPDYFKRGEFLCRTEVASRAGRAYSTVVYHLERCVQYGLLRKQYGYVGDKPGWGYALPETLPYLMEIDDNE